MKDTFDTLSALTDARFQAEMTALRKTAAAEAALRDALADLAEQERNFALREATDDMIALKTLGADILWRGWVGRKRAALNRDLALVLVRKAQETDRLRYAFGRNTVAKALADKAAHSHRQDENAKVLAKTQEFALLRRFGADP